MLEKNEIVPKMKRFLLILFLSFVLRNMPSQNSVSIFGRLQRYQSKVVEQKNNRGMLRGLAYVLHKKIERNRVL